MNNVIFSDERIYTSNTYEVLLCTHALSAVNTFTFNAHYSLW